MSLSASSKLSTELGFTFQARVAQLILMFFGVCEGLSLSCGGWGVSAPTVSPAAPRPSANDFAKFRRLKVPSILRALLTFDCLPALGSLSLLQPGAGSCICVYVAED